MAIAPSAEWAHTPPFELERLISSSEQFRAVVQKGGSPARETPMQRHGQQRYVRDVVSYKSHPHKAEFD
jgi:hypothetical protein